MGRDSKKEYVVTGPYVTMTTMTTQGKRVMGYMDGARVPEDIPVSEFDHLLAHGLIAATGEEPRFAVGVTPDQLAQQARDEEASARLAVAEAQARLDNARAQTQAAERSASDEADRLAARMKDQQAAADRLAKRQEDEEAAQRERSPLTSPAPGASTTAAKGAPSKSTPSSKGSGTSSSQAPQTAGGTGKP